MKRELLDSNIYGKIIEKMDVDLVLNNLPQSGIIVYGLPIIRKELRDTPREIRVQGANLRNYLLRIYDKIIGNHTLKIDNYTEMLAEAYFITYKEIGGHISKADMAKDFAIVASATLNNLDIVVSNDNKTMLSEKALKSYRIVNQIKKLKSPRFLNYEEFKKEIK